MFEACSFGAQFSFFHFKMKNLKFYFAVTKSPNRVTFPQIKWAHFESRVKTDLSDARGERKPRTHSVAHVRMYSRMRQHTFESQPKSLKAFYSFCQSTYTHNFDIIIFTEKKINLNNDLNLCAYQQKSRYVDFFLYANKNFCCHCFTVHLTNLKDRLHARALNMNELWIWEGWPFSKGEKM